ncbi:MAG TPA: response regulator transcription factor [Euzebyales bacterium]|nr:response regulator transcription factor [Euzebyales bacterium]
MTVRVVIVDDQALVRGGLRALVDSTDDLETIDEAADGAAAVDLVRRHRPDVVLMDIRMPGMDGLEATRRITADAALSGTRVVVLTTFETDETVFEALRAGASGFLLKDVRPAELLDAVRLVAAGEALLSPGATRRLIEAYVRVPPVGAASAGAVDVLTDREREVLGLVATGLSNGEIAERLVVSGATVKTHMTHLLRKLGARDRAQLVVIAYRAGVVSTTG